jgi:hypothetical protein
LEEQAELVPRATDDKMIPPDAQRSKMIPPDAQRSMAKRAGAIIVEGKGSHAIYVSQPEVVANLIAQAAERGR